MMKKRTLGAIAIALGMMLFGMNVHAKDSSRPIIIPVHNWSSQIAMSHAVGQMLTNELDCNVKYVTTDPQAVYEAIRVGEATFELQVWQESFGESFNSALAAKDQVQMVGLR